MSDLSTKYKKIINNIEKNIKDKDELEYVKEQIYAITALFLEELDKLMEISESKMQNLVQNQSDLQEKMSRIESSVNEIERDIYMDDEEFDFQIICPYCNNEFITELNELKHEVTCPECNNIIELDWNDEDCSCGDGCSCEGNHSCGCNENEDVDEDM